MDKPCRLDFNGHLVTYTKAYLQTIKRVGPVLFVLTLCGAFFDQWITRSMEAMLMNPQGTSHLVWVFGGLSLVWSVVFPLLSLLLILSGLQPLPMKRFWPSAFPQAIIELMRAWGKAMLWSFLFIIPGIVAFIRYLFVPFVVCLDPLYPQGQREALKISWALSKGRMGRLLGFFLLTSLFVPAALTAFDEWKIFILHPVTSVLICLLEMLLNISFSLWLWKIYQRSVQSEPALSVEGH